MSSIARGVVVAIKAETYCRVVNRGRREKASVIFKMETGLALKFFFLPPRRYRYHHVTFRPALSTLAQVTAVAVSTPEGRLWPVRP